MEIVDEPEVDGADQRREEVLVSRQRLRDGGAALDVQHGLPAPAAFVLVVDVRPGPDARAIMGGSERERGREGEREKPQTSARIWEGSG